MLLGHRNVIAEELQAGTRTKQDVDELSMDQYKELAQLFISSKHHNLHCYLVLTWNLEFRGASTKVKIIMSAY